MVLNLVINGLPSILKTVVNTFSEFVLNLVINGLPSIPNGAYLYDAGEFIVLNLVINGLPSIRKSGLELSLQ